MPPRETRGDDERAGLLARDVERGGGGATTSGARVDDDDDETARANRPAGEIRRSVTLGRAMRAMVVSAGVAFVCAVSVLDGHRGRGTSGKVAIAGDGNGWGRGGGWRRSARDVAARLGDAVRARQGKRQGEDDRAMRDEFLESRPGSVTRENVEEAKAFANDLARQWKRLEDRARAEDFDDDVTWMVRTAESSTPAADARGWWIPRTVGDRFKGDWLLGKASNSPLGGVSRSNNGRLENSPAHREAKLFNACPSLIHIAAEHASDSWASMVRQLGYAHGLRGATSAPLDTLKTIRSNPDGPNFVLGGVNTPSLSALSKVLRTVAARDAPRLTQSKSLFFIGGVRDPLERAVSSYMQYGVARRGWQPSVENFQSFVFGRYGRSAHVANIQFKTLAPESLVSKALDVESHAHNASAVTDEDIVSVLNFYDLLSTPEYESVSKLFLKQMLYRIVSVRQILDRPRVGYGKLDRFGFQRFDVKDLDGVLPDSLIKYIASRAFRARFYRVNALDRKLHAGANARLLRMWNEHKKVSDYFEWERTVQDWVTPRLLGTPGYREAKETEDSGVRVAKPCPVGEEDECAEKFIEHAAEFLDEERRRHASEQCLFENQGCFSRQIVNLGLLHYKRSRTSELASFFKSKETPSSYGVARASACAEAAIETDMKFCSDNSTLGSGTVGKSIIGLADAVYVLCAHEWCRTLCIPKMWESKVRLVNGVKVDRCLDMPKTMSHFRRATVSHGAIVAHAKQNNFANVAVVEADAKFIDPDPTENPKYDAAATVKSVARLLGNVAQESEAAFTILRVGYRAWEYETGKVACPHGCGCRYSTDSLDIDGPYCVVTRAQCDLRGSHAYVISRDSYSLLLEPVLSKKASQNKVIDFNVFQRFPQQIILTPMLAAQSAAVADADFIDPAKQMRDTRVFARTCEVR